MQTFTPPLKVVTIVGTRPELIRLCRIIAVLERHSQHVLIHTGQNYDFEMCEVFFQDLGIAKPTHSLNVSGHSAVTTVGMILQRLEPILEKERPDACVILGDTNSALAAIAAKKLQIPIFHLEAGNRCRDERTPEEINRKIVDHLADVNVTYTEAARDNLLSEGLPPDRTFKLGSPLHEVLQYHRKQIDKSSILKTLKLKPRNYFVVSAHREQNARPEPLSALMGILNFLAEERKLPIIFSVHPRTRKQLNSLSLKVHPLIRPEKPFRFFDYIHLQEKSHTVLSDSGTLSEEAALLGFRAINLRESQERHEGMEAGATILTGLNGERILQALRLLEDSAAAPVVAPVDYAAESVSWRFAKLVLSHIDYVRRTSQGQACPVGLTELKWRKAV